MVGTQAWVSDIDRGAGKIGLSQRSPDERALEAKLSSGGGGRKQGTPSGLGALSAALAAVGFTPAKEASPAQAEVLLMC